jgi:hypothetical protein
MAVLSMQYNQFIYQKSMYLLSRMEGGEAGGIVDEK